MSVAKKRTALVPPVPIGNLPDWTAGVDDPEPRPLAPPVLPHGVPDDPPVENGDEDEPEPRVVDLGPEHGVWRRCEPLRCWIRLHARAAREWRRAPVTS